MGNPSSIISNAAVDDIELVNGPCDAEASCNFEVDLCGYYNVQEEDDFDWIRGRGDSDSPTTGPSIDSTTQTEEGYYVYIDSSEPQKKGI
jgi:hypothetical protein